MKFLLTHTILNKPVDPPIALDVEPQRRNGYQNECSCQWVFSVGTGAHDELIRRRLMLPDQKGKNFVCCQCVGKLAGEAVDSMLERALAVAPPPAEIIEARNNFINSWRPSVYSDKPNLLDNSFEQAVDDLLIAHADCMTEMVPKPSPARLKLSRPLAVVDLETTDAEASSCAIFEFAVTVILPDGTRKQWSQRFKPWKPITPGAEEVTGTTNAMVADCPPFSKFAGQITKALEGKDLAGFNLKSFDCIVLDQELRRNGLKLNLDGVKVIDAFHIYQRKYPRDLTSAVRQFCGRDHEGAHGALADSSATADVLEGLLGMHPDLAEMSLADLDSFSMRDPDKRPVDLAGAFYRDTDGDLRYTAKKVRDVKIKDDPGYGLWMLKNEFAENTKEVLRSELQRLGL